jgi:hypothetical protein
VKRNPSAGKIAMSPSNLMVLYFHIPLDCILSSILPLRCKILAFDGRGRGKWYWLVVQVTV